jgi:hypothetical protein
MTSYGWPRGQLVLRALIAARVIGDRMMFSHAVTGSKWAGFTQRGLRHTAQVVKLLARGDGADCEFVGVPMGAALNAANGQSAIAGGIESPKPRPTRFGTAGPIRVLPEGRRDRHAAPPASGPQTKSISRSIRSEAIRREPDHRATRMRRNSASMMLVSSEGS